MLSALRRDGEGLARMRVIELILIFMAGAWSMGLLITAMILAGTARYERIMRHITTKRED